MDILERAMGVDPSGERTVGVLTKSDMISPGSEDEVPYYYFYSCT